MKVLITNKNAFAKDAFTTIPIEGIEVFTVTINHLKYLDSKSPLLDANIIIGGEELKDLPLERFTKLQLIQLISSGIDYLDHEKIIGSKIKLANAVGIYSVPIAEWVLGLILYKFKKIEFFKRSQANHRWNPDFNLIELYKKKALIFGTGSIGQEICKRLNTFGCRVEGVNSNGRLINGFLQCHTLKASRQIIGDFDILIFSLPSNEKTIGFLSELTLKEISASCLLINVGRGDLIVEKDLLKVLETKKEVQVILDVFNQEPLPAESLFWDHPQIFVSPHTSFSSIKNKERLKDLVIRNITNFKDNKDLINEISMEVAN